MRRVPIALDNGAVDGDLFIIHVICGGLLNEKESCMASSKLFRCNDSLRGLLYVFSN